MRSPLDPIIRRPRITKIRTGTWAGMWAVISQHDDMIATARFPTWHRALTFAHQLEETP